MHGRRRRPTYRVSVIDRPPRGRGGRDLADSGGTSGAGESASDARTKEEGRAGGGGDAQGRTAPHAEAGRGVRRRSGRIPRVPALGTWGARRRDRALAAGRARARRRLTETRTAPSPGPSAPPVVAGLGGDPLEDRLGDGFTGAGAVVELRQPA